MREALERPDHRSDRVSLAAADIGQMDSDSTSGNARMMAVAAGGTMDAQSVLSAQILMALDDARTAKTLLQHPAMSRPANKAALRRFEKAFNDREREFERLHSYVSDSASHAECWGQLRSIRTDFHDTLRESLAFLGALLVRQSEMDERYTAVVDTLLWELASVAPPGVDWPSVTIAVGDAFSPLAGTVRTRYPDFTIWALPVVGHEVGHLLVQELRSLSANARSQDFPLVDLAARQAKDNANPALHDLMIRELLADLIGVWSLGPAFACSSILLRFTPRDADKIIARHPPEVERVYVVLRGLRRVDPEYADLVSMLEAIWADLLTPLNLAPLANPEAAILDACVEDAMAILDEHLSGARYAGRTYARSLVQPLATGQLAPAEIAAKYNIRDIANAAWIARLRSWGDVAIARHVDDLAMAACREVAALPGKGAMSQ